MACKIATAFVEDALQDSWVHVSRRSRSNSSSNSSITSCTERTETSISSVSSSNGAASEVDSNPDVDLKSKILPPLIIRGKTHWNDYDWSSRCEALPPNTYPFALAQNDQISPLDSPNISVANNLGKFLYPWSLRHSKFIGRDWFSVEVFEIVLITSVISFCLGILVGRRSWCTDIRQIV